MSPNEAVGYHCPNCDGSGSVTGYRHACGGDDRLCYSRCPVPEGEPCEYCGGTGAVSLQPEAKP